MDKHRRIFAEHIMHKVIARFIEVWPDATIQDLAQAMPHILHEAYAQASQDIPADQLARRIITTLWNSNLIPPWVDIHVEPQEKLPVEA